jgi:glycosyltransferase involved in cell wall biosynthesis
MKTLSIIIPAYNEEKTIIPLLEKVVNVKLANNMQKEIVIVNDCSRDRTPSLINGYILSHPEVNIRLINQEKNQGKGAAIRKGIEQITGDYVIIQDADLEYEPEDYNSLLCPLLKGVADVVYGSRLVGGKPHRILFFWHTIGNKMLTFLSNIFTDCNFTDMETCYKLFKADIIKNIKLHENGFGFEAEITAKISGIKNIRLYEVGISYYGRTYAEGKKINWKDGFKAIYCIIKYNVFRKMD